jgi:hypothetical protein
MLFAVSTPCGTNSSVAALRRLSYAISFPWVNLFGADVYLQTIIFEPRFSLLLAGSYRFKDMREQ